MSETAPWWWTVHEAGPSRDSAAYGERMNQPLRITVRVKPGAKHDRVGGSWDGALGRALVVAVRASATEGKANKAVRAALAEALDVRPRDVTVVRGARSRDKIMEIHDPPAGAQQQIQSLLD